MNKNFPGAELTWINHAGYRIRHRTTELVVDPWLEGPAFERGWELISRSLFQYSDFATCTHIWFSHEHPDHFAPGNLRKIPMEMRKNISVIYQKTRDGKVRDFCLKLGFKDVLEPEPRAWCRLEPGFELM